MDKQLLGGCSHGEQQAPLVLAGALGKEVQDEDCGGEGAGQMYVGQRKTV